MDLLPGRNFEKIIVTDTSVLINFLCIDRIDLMKKYPSEFLITDHVLEEITHHHPLQQQRLKFALEHHFLSITQVNTPEELALFAKLQKTNRLGAGECSAIACGIHRHCSLAIDDVRARKQATKLAPNLPVVTTQNIMTNLIKYQIITIPEADHIKNEWQNKHRFSMNFASFCELIATQVVAKTADEEYF
jgi:hypothetical protein